MIPPTNKLPQGNERGETNGKENGHASEVASTQQQGRVITDPKEVAQLVMMRIDNVNAKKDELTIAVKGLADTAKQLVRAYAEQQTQILALSQRIAELEKTGKK